MREERSRAAAGPGARRRPGAACGGHAGEHGGGHRGIVPPSLQGHTPDIVVRFDPDDAREHLRRSGVTDTLSVACLEVDVPLLDPVMASWNDVLDIHIERRSWTPQQALGLARPWGESMIYFTGWLPGYPDPEYYLRLLFQSDSKTKEEGFSHAPFDDLIEQARQERRDRERLELFHRADRMAVTERVAVIPVVYGRSLAIVKPWVHGWWEFGKSSASFADLRVDDTSPRVAASSGHAEAGHQRP